MLRPLLLGLVLLVARPGLAADPPEGLKPFQGKWVVKSATLGGRDHTDDFRTLTLTVTGDKYEATVNVLKDAGTLSVDLKASPKWLTLVSTEKTGPFKGRTMPGVFEFKDGELTVCLNSEKAERPTKFEAPEKSPMMLIVFTPAK